MLFQVPPAPLPILLPSNPLRNAAEDTQMLMGNPNRVSGFWLQSGPARVVAAIWGMNQLDERSPLCLSVALNK